MDLLEGGEEDLKFNIEKAKKDIKWQGEISEFEYEFNRNPQKMFDKYTLERMLKLMKK